MAAGAEAHPLRGIGEVGLALEESTLERRDVDQDLLRRRLAGKRGQRHGSSLLSMRGIGSAASRR